MYHSLALDGLRAIAVLIVITAHAGLSKLVPGGFGVTIFFFLSGYLITSLLRVEFARDGKINLPQFYVRRILRIFPPLYITLMVVGILGAIGLIPPSYGTGGVLADVLFLTNYSPLWTAQTGLPIPLWSLDVEEHFYLLFPIFYMLTLQRRRPFVAAGAIIALCVMVLLVRIFNVILLPDYSFNYYWSHTRIDSILFGCCLAVWQNPMLDEEAWRPKPWQGGLAVAFLLLTFLIRNEAFRESIRYTIQGACLFVLFAMVIQDKGIVNRILSSSYLKVVGLLSYTLYLCHMPMFVVAEKIYPNLGPFGIGVIGVVLSFAFSGAMYLLVEKPIAAWRRRLQLPKATSKLGSIEA